eukprot:m.50309 g.50309  ORF g.50309 m.50309 type:complete len:202 (-) comp10661_c0_seq1:140-745(-)
MYFRVRYSCYRWRQDDVDFDPEEANLRRRLHFLQYREINPNDYNLLTQLDDMESRKGLPKKTVALFECVKLKQKCSDYLQSEKAVLLQQDNLIEKPNVFKAIQTHRPTKKSSKFIKMVKKTLPKYRSKKTIKLPTETCTICQENFKENEVLRILPRQHVFHKDCIDPWILGCATRCPIDNEEIPAVKARFPRLSKTNHAWI